MRLAQASSADQASSHRVRPAAARAIMDRRLFSRTKLRYRFRDGGTLTVTAGGAFHLRGGRLAEVIEDAELIEFTSSAQYRNRDKHVERGRAHAVPR